MELKTIANLRSLVEAEEVLLLMTEEGIEAVIPDGVSAEQSFIPILVSAEDVESAIRVIREVFAVTQ